MMTTMASIDSLRPVRAVSLGRVSPARGRVMMRCDCTASGDEPFSTTCAQPPGAAVDERDQAGKQLVQLAGLSSEPRHGHGSRRRKAASGCAPRGKLAPTVVPAPAAMTGSFESDSGLAMTAALTRVRAARVAQWWVGPAGHADRSSRTHGWSLGVSNQATRIRTSACAERPRADEMSPRQATVSITALIPPGTLR